MKQLSMNERRMSLVTHTRDFTNASALLGVSNNVSVSNRAALFDDSELDNMPSAIRRDLKGLSIENIVPCFISKHVRAYCEALCWIKWKQASDKFSIGNFDSEYNSPPIEDIFRSQMKNPGCCIAPSAVETFAAVVMADVSGYSKLSASLAERGAEGAEILCRTMKGYLDKIIDIILKHGGDIVKFAGDAVIFYWKIQIPNNGNISTINETAKGETVLKAAHCCLDLLKLLGSYEVEIPEIGTQILRIHLGIGAGPVYDVIVGREDRWEHFIAGDGVNQLASVLDLAKAGELALSHQALKCFSTIVDIASVGIGSYDKRCIILTGLENAKNRARQIIAPQINTDIYITSSISGKLASMLVSTPAGASLAPHQIQTVEQTVLELYKLFINPSALCKLQTDINQSRLFRKDAGLSDLMSLRESRQITTIFIRLGSLTRWESKATLEAAQEAMSIVQVALKKYEGSLRQKHVDDKGATILIFFGLPPLAHENDASYGLKAGLEICEKFEATFDDFSIGITTGMVSIGGVGNECRIEYAVMGDSINMAARLMCNDKAAQTILCDEKTFRMCESEFLFENLGEIKVKGKSHAINIYKPKRLRPDSMKKQLVSENVTILGREGERRLISESLEAHSVSIGPRMLVIEADGGMGLSTLARWTHSEMEKCGYRTGIGHSAQMEKNTRYYIWRDIVCDILTAIESMEAKESRVASEFRTPTFLMEKSDHPPDKILKVSAEDDRNKREPSGGNKRIAKGMPSSGGKIKVEIGGPILQQSIARNGRSTTSKQKESTPPIADSLQASSSLPSNSQRLSQNKLKAVPSFESLGAESKTALITDVLHKRWSAFEDRLRQAFIKCGEAPTQSSLMNLIFPFEFSQSDVYAKLQGKFRINELTDLIRRIINVLTEATPMALMVHESQWIDPLSWELLWELAISCPKLMVCLFSRPEKYHENEETRLLYMKFKRHQKTEVFTLDGLSIDETAELIIASWPTSSLPVISVHQAIVENVQKKTGGNPLYIKSMVVALRESGYCRINEKQELRLIKDDFDFEKSVGVGGNLQSVLVAQFDRLDATFQLFLKVSSVLGQPFLLEDVLYLLSDTPGFNDMFQGDTIELIANQIKALDRYSFLSRLEGDSEGVLLQFKSSVVKKCIYSMMVVSQRQQLHLNVAVYYERVLDANNRNRLLLPLYEHYSETDEKHIMKKLSYLEAVAHVYFEKNSMGEAIKHYTNLLERAEKASKLQPSPVTFDPVTKSTWHREIGEAYFMKGDDQRCEDHLLQCLTLLDHPFPKNPILLEWKLYAQSTKRNKFPVLLTSETCTISAPSQYLDNDHNSMGSLTSSSNASKIFEGVRNVVSDEMQFDPMSVQLAEMLCEKRNLGLHNVRRAMATLAQIYLSTGQIKEHRYSVLKGTNVSEAFPHDALYAKFLSMCGALSWFSEGKKRMSLRYLESASKHDQRFDLSHTVSIVLSTALTLFQMGKWGSSMRRLAALPFLEMMSGDCSMRAEALRMRAIVIHMSGTRSQSLKPSRDLFTLATQEGNWEGRLWGCEMILANLLTTMQNDAEISEMNGKLKQLWLQIPERHKGDPILGINYLALTSVADLRLGSGFSIEPFTKLLMGYTTDLRNLKNLQKHSRSANASNAWGGGAASAGGPHHWLALIGLLHCGAVFMAAYDLGQANDLRFRKNLGKLCSEVESWLGAGQIMRNMTLTHPVRYLFKGIRYMLKNKAAPRACAAWKKGLACRRVSDLLYVRGVLHLRIAQYSTSNSESNHHAHEAQKVLRRIGSTYEFEKASALRKDKRRKNTNGAGKTTKIGGGGKSGGGESGDDETGLESRNFGAESKSYVMSVGGQSFDDRSDIG